MRIHRTTLLALAIMAFAVFSVGIHAQTLDFTAKQVAGIGSLVPQLEWSTVPPAKSCSAAGSGSWSGSKPGIGSAALGPITSNKTYNLVCYWDKSFKPIVVKWTPPARYVDGTPLTTLTGYVVTLRPSNVSVTMSAGSTTASLVPTSASPQTAYVVAVVGTVRSDEAKSNAVTPKSAPTSQQKSIRLTVSPKTS